LTNLSGPTLLWTQHEIDVFQLVSFLNALKIYG
jgi:hypothetical protein